MIVWGSYRSALDQTFAQACDDCLGPLPYTYTVYQGLRTMAEQAALYAQGRTAPGPIVTYAQPGDSAHNYGLAIDVETERNGAAIWNYKEPEWATLFTAVEASPTLHSGKDFPPVLINGIMTSEEDPDHIERFNWRQHIVG